MDSFGIGAGVKGAVEIYFRGARRTGRTTALVESVKNGDCICFLPEHRIEAERVQRLCRERGVEVKCITLDPQEPTLRETAKGRMIFDHSWIEKYYRLAIQRAEDDIAYLEREMSGYGAEHRETKLKAAEMSKWLG